MGVHIRLNFLPTDNNKKSIVQRELEILEIKSWLRYDHWIPGGNKKEQINQLIKRNGKVYKLRFSYQIVSDLYVESSWRIEYSEIPFPLLTPQILLTKQTKTPNSQ